MKRYSVCIPITGVIYKEVEAESEDAAIEKALEDPGQEIDEWETHRHVCRGNVFYGHTCDANAVEIED